MRRQQVQPHLPIHIQRAKTVKGTPQAINHAALHPFADRHL